MSADCAPPVPANCPEMNRMRVDELALTNAILQSDGGQPFEVMQLRAITADDMMHEKLHKFQASEYQKFATGSVKMDITTTPSNDVNHRFVNTSSSKRLKIQHTADIADPM